MLAIIVNGDDGDNDQRDSTTSSSVLIYATQEINDIDEMYKRSKFREKNIKGQPCHLVRASSSKW